MIEYDGSPHGVFASDKERLTSDLLSFLQQGAPASAFAFSGTERGESSLSATLTTDNAAAY